MPSSLDHVREKIAELEAKVANLRIAERELLALDVPQAKKPGPTARPEPSTRPKATAIRRKARAGGGTKGQTITGAVVDILRRHGPLPLPSIAKKIKGRAGKIGNRSVYYSLRELRKRGLVELDSENWTLIEVPAAGPTLGSEELTRSLGENLASNRID